jgi:hypothetical protein
MSQNTLNLPAPIFERIDPPSAVISAISTAKAACAAWSPTQVGTPEHPASPLQGSIEALICDDLLRPADSYPFGFSLGIGVGVFATVATILAWKLLHAGYRAVLRMVRRETAPA